ncbi:hypothetical protein BJX64DRAFT_262322 [Aspergillus heterothallicus]
MFASYPPKPLLMILWVFQLHAGLDSVDTWRSIYHSKMAARGGRGSKESSSPGTRGPIFQLTHLAWCGSSATV